MREALGVYPENLPAMVNLGNRFFHKGAREEAKQLFIDVLKRTLSRPRRGIPGEVIRVLMSWDVGSGI